MALSFVGVTIVSLGACKKNIQVEESNTNTSTTEEETYLETSITNIAVTQPTTIKIFDDYELDSYEPSDKHDDKRFYALNDGRIYYKEDGHDLKLLEGDVDVIDFQDQGFELIGPDSYQSNINILNDMIVRM